MGRLTLVTVPYDSGYRDYRMGRGPGHLLDHGVAERLRDAGHDVEVARVEHDAEGPVVEPAATFAVLRRLATVVAAAARSGRAPLVLAGNCITSVGTLAGLGDAPVGAVWLDAHGDLNTPETSPSGFLDGMALACLAGRCWSGLAGSVPGLRRVREDDMVLIGARELDPGERALIEQSKLRHLPPEAVGPRGGDPRLADALDTLRGRVERVYLHLDPDVLDAGVARFNAFAADGGLTVEQVEAVIDGVASRFTVAAATLSAYDPTCDRGALEIALRLVERVARHLD